jgi:hypothetical protein
MVPAQARAAAAQLAALFDADVAIVNRQNDAHRRLRLANERLAHAAARNEIHWAIHDAFCQYQFACEERRSLAVQVGELTRELIEALRPYGWSAEEVRAADVRELAAAPVAERQVSR